jgi:hypothetical protein
MAPGGPSPKFTKAKAPLTLSPPFPLQRDWREWVGYCHWW